MDSDEDYYDSLDEDSNYGSIESSEERSIYVKDKSTTSPSRIPVKIKKRSRGKETKESSAKQDDDSIPFYDQNISKSEVELKKMVLKYGPGKDKCRNRPRRKSAKKKATLPTINGRFKSNSYLDMFYARLGVDKLDLSSRATCTDFSPRSYITCDEFDLMSLRNYSESESVYSSNDTRNELSLSTASLESKLCSVSQINELNFQKLRPNLGYPKSTVIKTPELGSLGPDIPKDKLELFKKRLDYGLKASQKNKIKMMERKLLKNLQKEIKECKNVV